MASLKAKMAPVGARMASVDAKMASAGARMEWRVEIGGCSVIEIGVPR